MANPTYGTATQLHRGDLILDDDYTPQGRVVSVVIESNDAATIRVSTGASFRVHPTDEMLAWIRPEHPPAGSADPVEHARIKLAEAQADWAIHLDECDACRGDSWCGRGERLVEGRNEAREILSALR